MMTTTTDARENVLKQAKMLRANAEHFVFRDWIPDWDTDKRIKHIRLHGDYSGPYAPHRRALRVLNAFNPLADQRLNKMLEMGRFHAWQIPFHTVKTYLFNEKHLPDAMLDGGNVMTYWAETADYLLFVQPSVGSMFGKYMEAHPDDPEIQAIAREMERLVNAYKAKADELKKEKRKK